MKSYSQMIRLDTFIERFEYLKLNGVVGESTFGFDRVLNQRFYNSDLWKSVRNKVIIRDNGCELGMEDRPIMGRIYIHHINPIAAQDIIGNSPKLYDLDNLVCVSYDTHQAIHYGDSNLIVSLPIARTPNDTCPWKH